MKVRYTTEAASLIRKLHPEIKRLIRQAVRDLLDNPLIGHALRLNLSGFRSYRVKGYRVLYQINDRDGLHQPFPGTGRNERARKHRVAAEAPCVSPLAPA